MMPSMVPQKQKQVFCRKAKKRLDAQKDARDEMGNKCAHGGDKGGGGAGKGD